MQGKEAWGGPRNQIPGGASLGNEIDSRSVSEMINRRSYQRIHRRLGLRNVTKGQNAAGSVYVRGSDPTTGPAERSPLDGGHTKTWRTPGPGTQVRHGCSEAGVVFFSDAKWWTRGENIQAHTLPGSKPNGQGAFQQDLAGTPAADQGAASPGAQVGSAGERPMCRQSLGVLVATLTLSFPACNTQVGMPSCPLGRLRPLPDPEH